MARDTLRIGSDQSRALMPHFLKAFKRLGVLTGPLTPECVCGSGLPVRQDFYPKFCLGLQLLFGLRFHGLLNLVLDLLAQVRAQSRALWLRRQVERGREEAAGRFKGNGSLLIHREVHLLVIFLFEVEREEGEIDDPVVGVQRP